ncbi:MFS transporter [Planctobacterium marinum]|uniref:MFS transporter n=1 Tax=Planctobacterium marinum TaxID=1631968 RepID=UPI001E4B955E|nr:MFS transporter [Planctobacterium marinum]MCC2606539.1 MFS transporter [Planctobacterium marinum]
MKTEWVNGWRVVLAGSVGMGTGLGLYSMLNSIFIIPLQAEFGWERADMALSNIIGVLSLFTLPILGMIVDKYDSRRVACIGMGFLGLSYIALSLQPGSIWVYYATLLAMTFLGQTTGPMIFSKVVNTWFNSSRGLALGVTMSGITLFSMVLFPLLNYVNETWGWRVGFMCFALVPLVIGLPIVAWALKPAPAGYLSSISQDTSGNDIQTGGMAMKAALRSAKFWLLAAALVTSNVAVGGMMHQLQPLLIDQGFTSTEGASLAVFFFVGIFVGRLSSGWLLDRFWPAAVAALFLLTPLVGIFIFLSDAPAVFWLGVPAVFCFGLAQGAEVDFMAYLVPKYFGLVNYGKLFGILLFILAASLASGSYIYGYIFDYFGNYHFALLLGAACFISSSGLFLIGGIIGEDFDHTKVATAA